VIDTKVRLQVSLISVNNTRARESVDMRVATRDVTKSYNALHEAIAKAKGFVINAQARRGRPQEHHGRPGLRGPA